MDPLSDGLAILNPGRYAAAGVAFPSQSLLDRSEGGLGIGLALVEALVELHGGSVEALSQGPGRRREIPGSPGARRPEATNARGRKPAQCAALGVEAASNVASYSAQIDLTLCRPKPSERLGALSWSVDKGVSAASVGTEDVEPRRISRRFVARRLDQEYQRIGRIAAVVGTTTTARTVARLSRMAGLSTDSTRKFGHS